MDEKTFRLASFLLETVRVQLLPSRDGSFGMEAERGYVQIAKLGDGSCIVEVSASEFLETPLTHDEEASMRMLGFNDPEEGLPNWWIRLEPGEGLRRIPDAVLAASAAMVEVYGNEVFDLYFADSMLR